MPENRTTISFANCMEGAKISFDYTNWRREKARREAVVEYVWWGVTEWQPKPGWLMCATDAKKQEWRDFSMAEMSNVEVDDDR